ncbi:MAG: AhpC/TSA family protein [Vicinamibacterales bacterium]
MSIPLGDRTLWSPEGQPRFLRSLWAERKVIAVFVRHFGCVFCRQQVATLLPFEPRFADAGADLAIIGQGSVDDARAFRNELSLSCRVLTDPTREVYCALDLPRGARTMFRPSVFLRAIKARAQGFRQTRPGGDVLQQGGVLIFDKGGSQLYRFVSRSAGEHPSPYELLDVLGGGPAG